MKISNHSSKGFTFIEMLIYIALAVMVVGILFAYGWNIVTARVKANTMRETMSGAELMSEILKREIRSAAEVNESQSSFNNSPGKLVLTTPDGDIIIEAVDDKVSIKRGSEAAEVLHPDIVRIRNLQFIPQISSAGIVQYVGFSFVAEAYYTPSASRSEYNYSIPFSAGAEMRNQ